MIFILPAYLTGIIKDVKPDLVIIPKQKNVILSAAKNQLFSANETLRFAQGDSFMNKPLWFAQGDGFEIVSLCRHFQEVT